MKSFINNGFNKISGLKVLIIDDDEGLCNSLKFMFEDYNCHVITASNGEYGLVVFKSFTPDIVIVDLQMPGIGGHGVISVIAKIAPDTPIIVVSGTGVIKDAVTAMKLGAWEFIQKPVLDFEELEISVLKALEKRELIRENNEYKEKLEKLVLERTEKLRETINELNIAKEKAEQSDKLKTHFLTQISHEIRTPLNGILTSLSILKMELEDRGIDDLITDFERINSSSERIIRTVELILNMSEVQLGTYVLKPENVNVNLIINDTIRNYEHKVKSKGILLNKDFKFELNTVADKYSLEQIILNVIDNAYKFTDAGYINISIENEDSKPVLKICDSGIGISEDYMPNIYKPFSQEDNGYTRIYEGNGLGLPLSKKYCELNNIDIVINSKKNEGTCVKLVFNS